MKRLEEEYSATGFEVMWIGIQDKPHKLKAFAEKLGIDRLGYDDRSLVARSYGITYGAGLVFIDAQGTVRKRVPKGIPEETIRKYIELIIKGPDKDKDPADLGATGS